MPAIGEDGSGCEGAGGQGLSGGLAFVDTIW